VVAVYFVVLTTLTHWPQMDVLGPGHTSPDKMVHFLSFGLLAALLERSRLLPAGWMAFAAIAMWAPLDEWSQQWFAVARSISIEDVIGGWLGVLAAAIMTAMLRPPSAGYSQWRRAIESIDRLATPRRGGLLAAAVALVVTAAAFPIIFGSLWTGFGWSMSTLSALLSIAIGLVAAAPFTRRAWRRVSGPRWPSPPCLAWLLIPLEVAGGWIIGKALSLAGVDGLMTPAILFGGFIGCGHVIRIAWKRHEGLPDG
jgi:disulfide bond formation protein DsbB